MTLIMIDGFDDNLITKGKWTVTTQMVQTASGRNGDGAHFDHASGAPAQLSRILNASEEDDVITVGFAMKLGDLFSSLTSNILRFESDGGGTIHVYMRAMSSAVGGSLEFRHGSGALIGACPFGEAVWRYLEVQVKLHDTTGYLKVHLDGTEVLNLTNIDTKNGGTKTVFDHIQFLVSTISGSTPIIYIDDLYLLNEQGSKNNDFLNDCRVETLLPNAVGNYSQWTPTSGDNYSTVDENPPSDADYVEGDTSGEKDSYNFPALSDVGNIAGVQVSMYGKTDDAGTRAVKALTRQSAADSTGDSKTFNATPQTYIQMWELNPADAAAWEVADVDGAEFGIEVV